MLRLVPHRWPRPGFWRAPAASACGLVALLALPGQDPAANGSAQRPDIVVILADDMGYSDIGCYGGAIRTPRLDQLAAHGVRFERFYNTARCCPTRASLLTGLYPHQAGIGHMLGKTGLEGYTDRLNDRCVTMAEVLGGSGYRTYMAGKWHVVGQRRPNGDKSGWPRQRGFDRFYGTITGAGSFYDPATLCRGNTYITPDNDPEYQPETYYYTDAISDNASRYIRDHAKQTPDQPLFLYMTYTAAHWPMHALPDDIEAYRGQYDAGYEAARAKRYEKLKQLGLIDDRCQLSAGAKRWSEVPEERRAWEARCMEVYAAMVTSMDRGIGRVLDTLEATGRLDNTLVVYLQDNGGCAENQGRRSPRQPYRKYEPFGKDDLQAKIWPPMQTRDGRAVRTGPDVMPGAADTYVAYGQGWANVSNTPFREYKHWVHEGGIATPFIAHWPKGIPPERRGQIETEPGHLIDVMATMVDVAGAEYPKQRNGQPIHPMEGVSLQPALVGRPLRRDQPIFWEHEANCAIRDGQWKLVCKGSTRDGSRRPWELYDLEADPSETKNLADSDPDRVQALAARWEAWAQHAKVKPWPWRKRVEKFSQQRVFTLGPKATLNRAQSPDVRNAKVEITVRIDQLGDGVLLAHGGSSDGYALHIANGNIRFSVRRGGVLTGLGTPIHAEQRVVEARIERDGKMHLRVGTTNLDGSGAGPLRMPLDGLEVGRDLGGLVRDYGGTNAFTGRIGAVRIALSK